VAALALHDALVSVGVSEDQLALKWPNDVLLSGGKLAGILLEASGAHMAVGIGVNLAGAPGQEALEQGAVRPVSLVSETSLAVTPEAFLEVLAAAWDARDTAFRTFGFAPVRAAWMDRAARLGEVVTARTASQEISGTFEEVDAGGNLVLLTPKGRVAIPAADVYF
jgi:BirA family biotin operon repressor/biotin-[acetyl-CoA-carboxylase] ligase